MELNNETNIQEVIHNINALLNESNSTFNYAYRKRSNYHTVDLIKNNEIQKMYADKDQKIILDDIIQTFPTYLVKNS